VAAEQQEEVGVAQKELGGQGARRGPPHRVVGTADAQHGHGGFVHIPQGVIDVPVGVPAHGKVLGLAEEPLLKLPQRAAAQQLGHVHGFRQGRGVPESVRRGPGRTVSPICDTDCVQPD
uniref:Uncharacterized protein n=1 Tax=Ornithorhynchus anatinus TaxID=9258 RepID=A0A6I8PJR2_ORNAN